MIGQCGLGLPMKKQALNILARFQQKFHKTYPKNPRRPKGLKLIFSLKSIRQPLINTTLFFISFVEKYIDTLRYLAPNNLLDYFNYI